MKKSNSINKTLWLCEVDTDKTIISDFYEWNNINDPSLFCWRTFYVFPSWLPTSNEIQLKECVWTYREILESIIKELN